MPFQKYLLCQNVFLQEELERSQIRNYNNETGSITGILGQVKWESLKTGSKTIDSYCYVKVKKVVPVYQQMTLSAKLGVVEMEFQTPIAHGQESKSMVPIICVHVTGIFDCWTATKLGKHLRPFR